ncbi:MAG: ATP-grasp domain-containing protein [Nitrospinaceae bacterium]|nr:ATP-grasp domain-containing protein [Nitrospinaceae bacterium]
MTESTVTILMTCVNAQVAPGIMEQIKDHPDYRIRLIGCDAVPKEEILGRPFCDTCYSVPLGISDDYTETMLGIVKTHGVQIVFPGSDEECLALSKCRQMFEREGCRIACSDYDTVQLCFDKYRLMTFLKQKGIGIGRVYHPKSLDDLSRYADALGYPDSDFVIKPRSGRGSRGFRVISAAYDPYDAFSRDDAHRISLDVLTDIFRSHEKRLSEYLIMEMYPGDKYSADILISRGEVCSMVIRNNGAIPKINPPTQNARIVFDEDIRKYAEQIVGILPFDYFAQVEMGRGSHGAPGLIEINTRMDATLPITEGLGLNFFREMITYAMTGKMRAGISDCHEYSKRLRFRRYWSHLFEETDDDE